MVAKLIPPNRFDPITEKSGLLTLRTSIYLEENAAQTNESTGLTEADPASLRDISNVKGLIKRIESLESTTLGDRSGVALRRIKSLIDRVEELENSITPDNSNVAIKLSKSILDRMSVMETVEVGALCKKSDDQELISPTPDKRILKRIEELENSAALQTSTQLLKKIEALENTAISTSNSEILKRIETLENTLTG